MVLTPGWIKTGNFNVVRYDTGGGFPLPTGPGPSVRGNNFFAGGPSNPISSATQLIDVSAYASDITSGNVRFDLTGYFGGYASQRDNAILKATFINGSNTIIRAISIGSVTPQNRNNLTGLLLRSISGTLPSGTKKIRLQLQMTRVDGSYNDGYADNLSLTLTAPSSTVTKTFSD